MNKYLEPKELTTKPISSVIVGMYIINTNKISDMYCVSISDIKYKSLTVKLSNYLLLLLIYVIQFDFVLRVVLIVSVIM